MPAGLYETDALAWAETQATLLRRLAAGERVNEQIDWQNVIEEVNDVGLSQLRACETLLLQGLLHLMKTRAWPESRSADHWRDEAETFLSDAKRAFSPAMRQRIDLKNLYTEALRRVRRKSDESGPATTIADTCPYGLSDLFDADVATLIDQLAPTS